MWRKWFKGQVLGGVALCAAIALLVGSIDPFAQIQAAGLWPGALVVCIVVGMVIRTTLQRVGVWQPGFDLCAKFVLEVAVALMGASLSLDALAAVGVPLIAGIVMTVCVSIIATWLIARWMGISSQMAILVACGNAICGNSAIAAVAPLVKADSREVATAVTFTAVLGVAVVVLMPLVCRWLELDPTAGGALVGLTVYAVPQVLAAAAPLGLSAVQMGTLVKLVRVLMLGPVVAFISVFLADKSTHNGVASNGQSLLHFLPWFIVVFIGLACARSMGWIAEPTVAVVEQASHALALIAMAGLGLSVDVRGVLAAGARVSLAVTLSLVLLVIVALVALRIGGVT